MTSFSPCAEAAKRPPTRLTSMTDWYTVGLFAGLGVAVGIAVVGVLGGRRIALLAPLVGALLGVALGYLLGDVEEAVAGGLGGALGAFGSAQLVSGALGRGGTRLATGFFVVLGAVFVALLALVPVLGYVEAIAAAVLGVRLRRRAGKRYAGLRTLARD
jgi:hypothetical protein